MISVQDQLAAVAQAEQQGKNEENRQRDALQAKRDQEAQQERQRQANAAAVAKQRAKAAAVAKQRAKAAEAERKARQAKLAAEAAQDKARDQSYKDELRRLEIQKQKLALAREEARVKRENEFIDQELKSKAAQTDVIQSHADANRNLSEGGHDLLQSEGKAREEKASGWFN
ncbi:DUF5384 family protein [Salmonella enterica]|uniref:Hydrocephalus-inducing protein Hy-3 n=1 Tax=Salmonella enterica subsp. enterica serovar Weslaco TaxID=1243597 RepID=A0A5X3P0E0_SALET|nr:DUF5384 family protein [Salmonella enterica]EBP3401923.1 hypothetical protein [Salmonella enterica subsp. enterica]EAM2910629.1 hypothetical protein [Salmonella enterica]EAZ0953775.1 hypothetical protein [Salmonella enterica]EBB9386189.1 hypothetical protein [Salmonella enterica]EBQ2671732.1 hypothetical protein [Salmonella enterica]